MTNISKKVLVFLTTSFMFFMFIYSSNVKAYETKEFIYPIESENQVLVKEEELNDVDVQNIMINELDNKYKVKETRGYSYRYVELSTKQTEYSLGYLAFGQEGGPSNFTTKYSGFHWKDSSRVRTTVSFSLGFSKGPVSTSIGINPGNYVEESTGNFIGCPDHLLFEDVYLYVGRKYQVTRYAVYRKDNYAGVETFVGYEDKSIVNGKQFWVVTA